MKTAQSHNFPMLGSIVFIDGEKSKKFIVTKISKEKAILRPQVNDGSPPSIYARNISEIKNMKIKQLTWKKGYSDDPEKTFWYEAQFKPPFEYCVEPNIADNKWTAWNTNADGNDKKIGVMLTKKRAQEVCQLHFEKQVRKFLC